MPILIDTNLLLRSIQPAHPMHNTTVRALEKLMARQEILVISIQNVAEFWNTATRPESKNGLGLSIEEVREEVSRLEGFFEVLHETEASFAARKTLVIENRVVGVQVHDARLVAVMKAAGIRQIVTFNIVDFKRYKGIDAVHPDAI